MHPDPKKVQGVTEMTVPTDKQQLQSFLGMVNYMGTFIPNLSHHTEPLRAMLKKDTVFHWEEQQTRSFQKIKALIAKANETALRYYDRTKPVKGTSGCFSQRSLEHVSFRNTTERTSQSPLPARALQTWRQGTPTLRENF